MRSQPQEHGLYERLEQDEPGAHVHQDANGHLAYWACGSDCMGDERRRLGLRSEPAH